MMERFEGLKSEGCLDAMAFIPCYEICGVCLSSEKCFSLISGSSRILLVTGMEATEYCW
jgi:hypothetical protein